MTSSLSLKHILLALAVVVVWGTNFVVIKVSLGHLPPFLFAVLRFTFAVLPAIFFLKRPPVPWRQLAAYGILLGVGQFGFLYWAMNGHLAPGMASVVLQTQVLFTILLSVWLSREHVKLFQWLALLMSVAGIAVIGWHTDQDTSLFGLALGLFAAFNWGLANVVSKHSGPVNMVAYVVWSSLFALPPLLILSLTLEGWPVIEHALVNANLEAWACVLWQSFANALFGYAAWAWLLGRYPAATIAPMALLVPVVGIASAVWWLNEPLPLWKIVAAVLVVGGVAINLLWSRFFAERVIAPPAV